MKKLTSFAIVCGLSLLGASTTLTQTTYAKATQTTLGGQAQNVGVN